MNDNVKLIGWCEQNNVKWLLCNDGSIIYPGDGKEPYDRYIKLLVEYCEKEGLEFPEFTWDGYKWVKVSQNKQSL